ncbi:hypothetical protein G6F68_003438 [Rhizopus microsporus]|nr:hypothetical protein G6F67_004148 [Rhizopus microsporus]KAG1265583.1 hypothetical protein G6F68_003438 [Rhizopus microsporus]
MPIRVVKRCSKRLSKRYYHYGQLIASRTNLLLVFSLSFISYFSLPVIRKQLLSHTAQHTTSLDGQFWQNSPHVQYDNSTSNPNYIIQQIRLSHVDRPISFELVQKAHSIYTKIATNEALFHICHQHDDQCLIHAPPAFQDEQDWRQQSSHTHVQHYESHPLSIYANVTFNSKGEYIKADAILLSFVLKQQPETLNIWEEIIGQIKQELDMFKLLPYDISPKVQLSIVAYIIIFYLVSVAFGKSQLVKSGYTFGLSAVFLSLACFTTTWGIFDKLGITFNNVPWYLPLLTVNIACLENIFLFTNAVLDAGCDMVVKEKISRGIQSVGLPMTATLLAELMILSVGTAMDKALIKEFCLFAKVALIVDYILQMTFVIAILSIDIKRVELTDLDDRQMSKRLHELANYDGDIDQLPPDFCPVQETDDKVESKSCAECKDFKTHRVLNSLMLCFIVLGLSLFTKKEKHFHTTKRLTSSLNINMTMPNYIPDYQSDIYHLSHQFWSIINPEKEYTWLQVEPPSLFINDHVSDVENYIEKIQTYYHAKSLNIQYSPELPPSLFRLFLHSILQRVVMFLIGINVPMLILWLCLIGIITWMTPKWRDQWLLPLLVRAFNKSVLAILTFIWSIHDIYKVHIKGINTKHEYDANGLHRGAITAQVIFNQERAHIKDVHVRTLTHQHVADIQQLNANAKGSLVSCGHDGRLVLWDTERAKWIARLDKLYSRSGILQATLNPDYRKPMKKKHQPVILPKNQNLKPICVKVDRGNKWVAAGYDDHTIRVWNLHTGVVVREMDIVHHVQVVLDEPTLRNRFSSTRREPNGHNNKHRNGDRILDIQFIGAITEYCHPLIAEAAARARPEANMCQNYVLSVHKSGLIREWNIVSGECIQTIKTGHTKDITLLHVVDAKAHHRKLGVTWVFTGSKDGTIKCWERQLQETSQWTLLYTVEHSSPITAMAIENPLGGMGILVSGSLDGTLKVWNFETGEPVCTLSDGKAKPEKNKDVIGSSIRHFSNFNDLLTDSISDTESTTSHQSPAADRHHHRGSIQQIAITRSCEVGPCRDCDSCFGSGFFIASSALDNKVHAWRLARLEGSEGSCTLSTRDYFRKQYKHRKIEDSGDFTTRRRRSPSQTKKTINRHTHAIKTTPTNNVNLLDIEQLGGDAHVSLFPTFLGKIDQPAGRGLVFCDKILAGVRRRRGQKLEWEAWFAALEYFDPEEGDETMKIPVETFSLDQEDRLPVKEDASTSFFGLFRSSNNTATAAGSVVDPPLKYKRICSSDEDDAADRDEDEAGENLPFSTIRHVIPIDGKGFACDYGNFIKLVYVDNKPSPSEKEVMKSSGILEESGQDEEITKDGECSPATRGKDGCCGGVNKKKNGGLCCGEKRRVLPPVRNNACGIKNAAECSQRHNCSRSFDCAQQQHRQLLQ